MLKVGLIGRLREYVLVVVWKLDEESITDGISTMDAD